ncbi:hypothetical protein [Aquipuribacter sp. SD81]|uniref:hypothetical protein n=1 Tax=Aquipuribacter sp. SD81 TaxID=3127703 RepID=UPI0030182F20
MPAAATHARAPRRTAGLAGRLNSEWGSGVADQVEAALPRWSRTEVALALPGVAALEAAASARDNDEVLRALLRLHRGGDPLAGRALLQLLLGVALGLARRTCHHAGGDREESEARAVTELLDLLGTVPLTTGARVADRLALDLLSRLTRAAGRRGEEHAVGGVAEVEQALAAQWPVRTRDALVSAAADSPGETRADLALLDVLVQGTRRGAIGTEEARLLWEVHSPAASGGIERLARDTGVAAPALRQRVSRARRRLVDALAEPHAVSAA